MILTTTNTIEGYPIKEYKGIITGENIIGANVVRDFMAKLTDFFGGRSSTYEKVFIKAKNEVLKDLENQARIIGANAVIGISFDYETVGPNSAMLMLTVNGTAVVI